MSAFEVKETNKENMTTKRDLIYVCWTENIHP